MKLKLSLRQKSGNKIPFNYQYLISSAIYKFIKNADEEYSEILHKQGFGKGFKFFTFSELKFKEFKWDKDGIIISDNELVLLYIDIFLPKTAKSLIKGIFENKNLFIADKSNRTEFVINTVEVVDSPLQLKNDDEIVKVKVSPTSPIIIGKKNIRGNYDFLSPTDEDFIRFLIQNWKEKIKTFEPNASFDFIDAKITNTDKMKTRLITMKANTPQETKIRGYTNFEFELFGKKKEIDLLISGGIGIYNAQGMGSVKILEIK